LDGALGRCRRAAYIYAELLGNMALAASALVTGRHWREAAVLYRDRLHRPDEAARCLEQGGLWTEAIALYEELGEHEKVGDLYRQLDQPDRAEQAYRAAVAGHVVQNDYLAAARLLEGKLDAPEEALVQLNAGWPSSSQAGVCLQQAFRLLARLGRHAAAAVKIEQLREQPLSPPKMLLLVDILSETAITYPDAAVEAAAADATRTLAGARLHQGSAEEKLRLLEAVRRLVMGDRLLGRDCQRFLRPRVQPPQPVARPATVNREAARRVSSATRVEQVRQIKLPGKVRWHTAVSAGDVLYAAGYEDKKLVVEQVFWEGTHVRLRGGLWHGVPLGERPILLAPDPRGEKPLAVYVLGSPPLPQQSFPVADAWLGRVRAGTPSWVDANTIALQRTPGGVSHVLQRQAEGLVLQLFNYKDEPLGSRHFSYGEILPEELGNQLPLGPVPLHARSDGTYFALGNRLVIAKPLGGVQLLDLADTILSLDGSLSFSRTRLVATMEMGALLYWDDATQSRVSLASELVRPAARFSASGWLAIASPACCHIYRTEGHRVRLEAEYAGSDVELLAVLDTADPNQFALFGVDGVIRVYQMPQR